MKIEDAKVGMKVRVNSDLEEAITLNGGYGGWNSGMDKMVGKEFPIDCIHASTLDVGGWVFNPANLTPVQEKKVVKNYKVGQVFKITAKSGREFYTLLSTVEGKVVLICLNDGNYWSWVYKLGYAEFSSNISHSIMKTVTGDANKYELAFDSVDDMIAGIPAVLETKKSRVKYTKMQPVEFDEVVECQSEEHFRKDNPDVTILSFEEVK